MAGYLSTGTTDFSNISATGDIKASSASVSVLTVTGSVSLAQSPTFSSGVSTSAVTAGKLVAQGGAILSGVTADFRTNSVIPSMITYAGGASISGLTIGQWGFVQNASGFSIAFSSGKSAYFFGGSTLSAAIT